jgi:hypothetical protein
MVSFLRCLVGAVGGSFGLPMLCHAETLVAPSHGAERVLGVTQRNAARTTDHFLSVAATRSIALDDKASARE